jgi:hypothetical protein
MSPFIDDQKKLATARADRDEAAAAIDVDRARLNQIDRKIAAARRTADDQRLAGLESERASLAQQIADRRAAHAGLAGRAADFLAAFAADPAKQVGELSDQAPILMFPLRLETRFRGRELLIRVYPDDCQIDGFEPLLSDGELAAVDAFWTAMWRAGGDEAGERGAWRALVGSVGSGRAAYLIKQRQPANPTARPVKNQPTDVVLVIRPAISVTASERDLAVDYWRGMWAADGDPDEEADALTTLEAAVGAARASEIIEGFAPDPNGWDPPAPRGRSDVALTISILEFDPPPPTKPGSWTRAAHAVALPDRLVALLYRDGVEVKREVGRPIPDRLATTPDPSLDQTAQIRADGDDLILDDELAWVADFDRAVEVGMGFRVGLTADEARDGFSRLLVLGVRASADPDAGRAMYSELLDHQLASKAGAGIAPQGSPTNNTGSGPTGYSWIDDADASFDRELGGSETFAPSADPLARRDGEHLAEALDLAPSLVGRLAHAAGTDQAEARAMNLALWNATFGYALEEMLPPLVDRGDIAQTRRFFARFVSGRGPLPALRVGRQPYGVLPAMAFSRYQPTRRQAAVAGGFLDRLHGLIARMAADWRVMADSASHVGAAGDRHQVLLDVLGLHAGSVEYHQRYAESFDQLYNTLVLQGGSLFGGLLAGWLAGRRVQLLEQLGADPEAEPAILEKFFFGDSPLLDGPVVDDVPLSESEPIRAYSAAGENYIEWMLGASLDSLRRQDLGGEPAPTALLYLLLRHSLMLGHWDAGVRLLEKRDLVDSAIARREPAFIHIAEDGGGESKLAPLMSPAPAITGSSALTLADHVRTPSVLAGAAETADLREQMAALEVLADAPTARLERAFAEHVDCATYRLDAWKTGFAASRLAELRAGQSGGLLLGAFGWLEDVGPRESQPKPIRLTGENRATFQRPGDPPLVTDPDSGGFVHAPSLDHAATAAILLNAYRSNADSSDPDRFAVNLSSARVRDAIAILDGVRNGQTLGALLGYRFERGLHDRWALAEVDKLIYPLRQAFPLAANQLRSTADPTADIRAVGASNVIDGHKLLEHVDNTGEANYPFGLASLPAASAAERAAVDGEVERLADLSDAVGDLLVAEGVYQVVRGNFDRAAATTTALQRGARPPEIEVTRTPRGGLSLAHRVALHLDPAADPAISPSAAPMTPRAIAEAPLNLWLASRMPDPDNVAVEVRYTTPVTAGEQTAVLTQTQLGLQPIDLVMLGELDPEQAMADLDDRIVQQVRYGADAHPSMDISIAYAEPVAGSVSLFELSSLVRELRALVLGGRPLAHPDMAIPLEARRGEPEWNRAEVAARIQTAITALTARRDALALLAGDAAPLDDYAKKVSDELVATSLFGVPGAGSGSIHADIAAIYRAIAAKVGEVAGRWTTRMAEFDALMATYGSLADDAARLELLVRAELLVARQATLAPPPLAAYKIDIEAKRAVIESRRDALAALASWAGTELAAFVTAVESAAAAIADHDAAPFDIDDQKEAMVRLRTSMVDRVTALTADLTARIDAAQAAVDDPGASLDALTAAARQVLGDEMRLVPRFSLDVERAAELVNCVAGSPGLLADLQAAGRRYPVDDWLYGVARVRDPLAAWESATILSEGFGAGPAELTPLQLPFVAGDRWTALEFDTATAAPDERLLYTACFATGFDPAGDQLGLVLDEWTEVIPASEITSGLTFHYDRPGSQPPQAMLLAVPPVIRGRWQWDDLVAMLHEVLDGARERAVEPAHVDASAYSQLLPATMMATTLYWITIATNLAMNVGVYRQIGAD